MYMSHAPKPLPDTNVLAIDAIALLSGVNFGSVSKVLSAIAAISEHVGLPTVDHLDPHNTPPTALWNDAQTGRQRALHTSKLVHDLVAAGRHEGYEHLTASVQRLRANCFGLDVDRFR